MMKKLLSTVLSVCMLLTAVLALPVMAEDEAAALVISATEDTLIELENYADSIGVPVIQREGTHGGAYICTAGGSKTAQTISIPISVEETGVYTLEFVAAYGSWLSPANLCINNYPVIKMNSTAKISIDPVDGTYFDPMSEKTNNFPAYKYVVPVALVAGQQTLALKLDIRVEIYGSNVAFAADYIKLTPGADGEPVNPFPEPDPVVSAIDDTYIELENYAKEVGVSVIQREGTHGGAYAFNGGGGTDTQTFNIPVTVEKTGAYMLEYVGSNASFLSYGTVCVNDATVISLQESANVSVEPAEGTYFDPKSDKGNNFPACKYTVPVTLYEGTQKLSVNFYIRTASGAAYAADYIKLTPITSEVAVSGTEETYIDFENHTAGLLRASTAEHEKAHNGSYLKGDLYVNAHPQPAMAYTFPFHAEKGGYYDIEVRMNKKSSTYVSKNTVYVDGYKLFTNDSADNFSVDASEENTFDSKDWPMHSYFTRIYLTEGEHAMYFDIEKAASQNLLTIHADYAKFTPAESYVLSTEEPTIIEAEALKDNVEAPRKANLVEDEPNASGNAYLYTLSAGTRDSKYHIPFTVEKDGVYYFETVQAFAGYMSVIEFYLDRSETPIYVINSDTQSALQPENQPFNADKNINTIAKLYQFIMELPAGEHGMTVVYKTRPAHNDTVAYASDYFRFTYQGNEATLNATEKTVSVTANYKEPVSGMIVFALYAGNKMVGITSMEQMDITTAATAVPYTGDQTPDKVKVFVWDSLTNFTPFETIKTIAVK